MKSNLSKNKLNQKTISLKILRENLDMDGIERKEVQTSPIAEFLSSSVGKKQVIAVTGILLSLFLVGHLLGNFLLLISADAFNLYAHKLTSTALIYVAEAGLALLFLVHFSLAMKLTWQNKIARGQKYYKKVKAEDGANIFSRSMPITGFIVLIFMITHLFDFKFGSYYTTVVDGQEIRNIHRTVMEYFASPYKSAWYTFVMLVLSAHLFHGIQSTFQSLGINSQKWNCLIRGISKTLGVIIPMGFVLITLWCHYVQK